MVWATGAALATTLALTGLLLLVVLANGLTVFWPHALVEVQLADGRTLLGEEVDRETVHVKHGGREGADGETAWKDVHRIKYKTGNRELGEPFVWVDADEIVNVRYPDDAFKLDRETNLNYYGYLKDVVMPGLDLSARVTKQRWLEAAIQEARSTYAREVAPLVAQEAAVAAQLNDRIKYVLMDLQYRRKQLLRQGVAADAAEVAALDEQIEELQKQEKRLKATSHKWTLNRLAVEEGLRKKVAVFVDASGRESRIALVDIVRFVCPNRMTLREKTGHYMAKVWELVSANPREANQDGGLFPAIFGTVLMVFLMAIACFPLGVLAGIYLGEYAKEGPLVRLVRIAVNNLAGIPSIVYGIFGLGFFVYICGSYLDQAFFPARVDASEPVFGQPCILWASLTLGLLTIPVVIVSTEEALRAIPRGVSEGSYALGGTKLQTLWRVLLPMASPGIMTGFILAMARAAGEVAPLMITGAVKSAPVPVEGSFPYVHLERQFMHLGFHILDISCKAPNVEAVKPMVYVTTLLLLAIVLTMTSLAIWLRNRMRKRFQVRAM